MKHRFTAIVVVMFVAAAIITKSDLEARQIAALRQKNPNFRPDSDTALKKALEEVTPGVIVDAVNELLMVQRGKELGYTMSNEQFNNIVDNIKKENKIENDEQLQAALKHEGGYPERAGACGAACAADGSDAEAPGDRHRAEVLLRLAQRRVRHHAASDAA